VINCVFSMNSADQKGGGIAVFAIAEPNVTNMTNCTFSENSAAKAGAVALWENSNSKLINCILWENTATKGSQLELEENSITLIKYCNLQGGSLGVNIDSNSSITWDFGNVNSDPLFVNTANADYHLQAGSPCVDSGDNTAIPQSVTVDLDENPRILNDIVDMGAYEYNNPLSQRMRDGNPSPADQAKVGSVTQGELRWEGTSDVNTYNIYFSTDPNNLALYGNVQKKGFMKLPVLKNNCRHFWRVDSIQSGGSVIPAIVWSFSTVEGLR